MQGSDDFQVCAQCGQKISRRARDYATKIKFEGELHEVAVPALEVFYCPDCNAMQLDSAARNKVHDALRAKLGLLLPAEIRTKIERLGKQHKEVAEELEVTPETISRWCSGALIQSRKKDAKMRQYFEREHGSFTRYVNLQQALGSRYRVSEIIREWESIVREWNSMFVEPAARATLFEAEERENPAVKSATNSNYALAA